MRRGSRRYADTYLAAAHTVTQVTQDAECMAYPQFRARLLRMAAEEGHVTWLHDHSSPRHPGASALLVTMAREQAGEGCHAHALGVSLDRVSHI